VSILEFLTPEATGGTAIARTPMERLAMAAGARFEQRDGWNVAVSYGEGVVGDVAFADRSHMAKLELHGDRAALARVVGGELEPGVALRANDAWWCPVTPARVLVLGEPSAARELRAAVSDDGVSVVDVTCGLAALALVGSGARELFARFCAIDVRPAVTPVGSFRPGSVARTPGYVLVEDEQRLLVMVGWALGEYLYEVVSDAAGHLGGGPVGADALEVRQLA
jgi:heterotetrameric sarcosine oxidase gamma subunit